MAPLLPNTSRGLNLPLYLSLNGHRSPPTFRSTPQPLETTVYDTSSIPQIATFDGIPMILDLPPSPAALTPCAPISPAGNEYLPSTAEVATTYLSIPLELAEQRPAERFKTRTDSTSPGLLPPPKSYTRVSESKHTQQKPSLQNINTRAPQKSRSPPKSLFSVFDSSTESLTRRRYRRAFTEEGKKKVEAVRNIGACAQCRARKRTVYMPVPSVICGVNME